MQHTARSGLYSNLPEPGYDPERVGDPHRRGLKERWTCFVGHPQEVPWKLKSTPMREVLLPKVALRKRGDKTNFDGQADDCLARGKSCHWKCREKTARKETTPMKRDDADDEGVQGR